MIIFKMSLSDLRSEFFGEWSATRTADGTIALFSGGTGYGVFDTPAQAFDCFMSIVYPAPTAQQIEATYRDKLETFESVNRGFLANPTDENTAAARNAQWELTEARKDLIRAEAAK